MVLIGSLIGWVTNYIAIKLLFKPYDEKSILGIKLQGLIPKRKPEIAIKIGETVDRDLISIQDITKTIDSMELETEIDSIVEDIVEKKIRGDLLVKLPMAKMFINDSLMEKLKGYIKDVIEDKKGEMVNVIIDKLESEVDFKAMIAKKIEEFSIEEMEKITMNIAKKELKHIEYVGAILGAVIGALQFLITQFI